MTIKYGACALHAVYLRLPTRTQINTYGFSTGTVVARYIIQGDKKEYSTVQNNPHKIDDLKMAITEYIWNMDHAILNTVFENTFRRVNKCMETGGGHFEHYL
jgi:hypothetical protein